MNECYVTWNCLAKLVEDKDGNHLFEDCSQGAMFDEFEDADLHVKTLVLKDGCERVLLLKLQLWQQPELVSVFGEITGAEALDGFGLEQTIRSAMKAAVKWAASQFAITRCESEVV